MNYHLGDSQKTERLMNSVMDTRTHSEGMCIGVYTYIYIFS